MTTNVFNPSPSFDIGNKLQPMYNISGISFQGKSLTEFTKKKGIISRSIMKFINKELFVM